MQDSFGQSNVEQSTMESIVDQLEELIVTIVEEIRERPGVAVAILAAIVGVVVGSMVAAGVGRRPASPPSRVAKRARGVGDAADLASLAMKLLQNPLIRAFVLTAVQRQVKKRFSR